MAERRMFAKTIVLSDAFLDMPLSTRCLYFTLGMLADDDGFINSPKSIMRQCGASDDDLKMLIAKKYVLAFESGIIVIKHWRINNYLRSDRYKETPYQEELSQLEITKNGSYTFGDGIPNAGIPSIGKDSIGKNSINNTPHSSGNDIAEWFNEFWQKYPRKVSKKDAFLKFKRVCNSKDTFQAIMNGLDKYIGVWNARGDTQFIPHPSTWLNQERWNDEITKPKGNMVFTPPNYEVKQSKTDKMKFDEHGNLIEGDLNDIFK